ncbi:helix-turn-helix domain-containing protein [Rhodococcus sp. KBS0724]|uniref:helix-turn-helix domain-containing protein n=1 Tax=Rhodococcus sp. KBS0724 TaxID=1179674 RepID=UPI00110D7715|nr:helix-turn-helix domain-containing protein [Rhodococcus sp. KBS0724]
MRTKLGTHHPLIGSRSPTLVMDLLRDMPRLTLADISRQTGIPRTSTHRLLERLVRIH